MRLRKESRAGAWADLQERLMTNMAALVPDITSLKDMLGLSVSIEEFMKTEVGSQSLDPSEALQRFLNAPSPRPAAAHDRDEGPVQ